MEFRNKDLETFVKNLTNETSYKKKKGIFVNIQEIASSKTIPLTDVNILIHVLIGGLKTPFRNIYASNLVTIINVYKDELNFLELEKEISTKYMKVKPSQNFDDNQRLKFAKLYVISVFQRCEFFEVFDNKTTIGYLTFLMEDYIRDSKKYDNSLVMFSLSVFMDIILVNLKDWNEGKIYNLFLYPFIRPVMFRGGREVMNMEKVFCSVKLGKRFRQFFDLLEIKWNKNNQFLLNPTILGKVLENFVRKEYLCKDIVHEYARLIKNKPDSIEVKKICEVIRKYIINNSNNLKIKITVVNFIVEIMKELEFDTFLKLFDYSFLKGFIELLFNTQPNKANMQKKRKKKFRGRDKKLSVQEITKQKNVLKYFLNQLWVYGEMNSGNCLKVINFFGKSFSQKVLSFLYFSSFDNVKVFRNILNISSSIELDLIETYFKLFNKRKRILYSEEQIRICFLNCFFEYSFDVEDEDEEVAKGKKETENEEYFKDIYNIPTSLVPILSDVLFNGLDRNRSRRNQFYEYLVVDIYKGFVLKNPSKFGELQEFTEESKNQRNALFRLVEFINQSIEKESSNSENRRKLEKLRSLKLLIHSMLVHQLNDCSIYDNYVLNDIIHFCFHYFENENPPNDMVLTLSSAVASEGQKMVDEEVEEEGEDNEKVEEEEKEEGGSVIIPIEVFVDSLIFVVSQEPSIKMIVGGILSFWIDEFTLDGIPKLFRDVTEELLLGMNDDEKTELESIVSESGGNIDDLKEEDFKDDEKEIVDMADEAKEKIIPENLGKGDEEIMKMAKNLRETILSREEEDYLNNLKDKELNSLYDEYGNFDSSVQTEMRVETVRELDIESEENDMKSLRAIMYVLNELLPSQLNPKVERSSMQNRTTNLRNSIFLFTTYLELVELYFVVVVNETTVINPKSKKEFENFLSNFTRKLKPIKILRDIKKFFNENPGMMRKKKEEDLINLEEKGVDTMFVNAINKGFQLLRILSTKRVEESWHWNFIKFIFEYISSLPVDVKENEYYRRYLKKKIYNTFLDFSKEKAFKNDEFRLHFKQMESLFFLHTLDETIPLYFVDLFEMIMRKNYEKAVEDSVDLKEITIVSEEKNEEKVEEMVDEEENEKEKEEEMEDEKKSEKIVEKMEDEGKNGKKKIEKKKKMSNLRIKKILEFNKLIFVKNVGVLKNCFKGEEYLKFLTLITSLSSVIFARKNTDMKRLCTTVLHLWVVEGFKRKDVCEVQKFGGKEILKKCFDIFRNTFFKKRSQFLMNQIAVYYKKSFEDEELMKSYGELNEKRSGKKRKREKGNTQRPRDKRYRKPSKKRRKLN